MPNIFETVSAVMPYLASMSLMKGSKSSVLGALYTACTSSAEDITYNDSPMIVTAHGLLPKRFLEGFSDIQDCNVGLTNLPS